VADDWQGRGVGTQLLDRLVERARAEGVDRFTALVLAENEVVAEGFDEAVLALVPQRVRA